METVKGKRIKESIIILIVILLSGIFSASSLYGQQDISGAWRGALIGGSHDLRIILTITKENGVWQGTMNAGDDPKSITELTAAILDGPNLTLNFFKAGGVFEGKLSKDGSFVVGIWERQGHQMPMLLRREPTPLRSK